MTRLASLVVRVAAGASLAFTGCESATPSAPGSVEVSSEALPSLMTSEELRLGSADSPETGFSRVGGIAPTSDGYIAVLEQQAAEIRLYDAAGQVVRVLGRRGRGPGEFIAPGNLGSSGDTIWAWDYALGRLTLFRTDGTLLHTVPGGGVRVPVAATNTRLVPDRPTGDGRFTSRLFSASEGIEPVDSAFIPAVVFDADGQVVDTAGMHFLPSMPVFQTVVDNYGVIVPTPLEQWPIRIPVGEDTIIVIREAPLSNDLSRFTLTRTGARGDTVYHTVVSFTPTPVDRDSVVAEFMRTNGQLPVAMAAVEAKIREHLPQERFHTPVLHHILGADNSLLLQREDPGGPFMRWLLVDSAGAPLGHVAVPRNTRIMAFNRTTLWVVEQDELNVPWIARLRIE